MGLEEDAAQPIIPMLNAALVYTLEDVNVSTTFSKFELSTVSTGTNAGIAATWTPHLSTPTDTM